MASPTSRTLAWLRAQGYHADVVERWNAFARIRQDYLGMIDILCVKAGARGCVGVQATSTSNLAARRTKVCANPLLPLWLGAGNQLWLVGWSKRGPRGGRKTWQVTWEPIGWESVRA